MIVTTFNLEFVLLLRLYVRDDFEPNLTIFLSDFSLLRSGSVVFQA